MSKDYIDFTIATIKESYNVDVEIKNEKVIFPAKTSEYIKLQVNNFWEAILAGEAARIKKGFVPR